MPERELVHSLDVECFKLLSRVTKHDPELVLAAKRWLRRSLGRLGAWLRDEVA
jgi:hypothetical protein